MDKYNLPLIFQNSKSHIDKTIYSYLFMLTKYVFLWKNGIKDKTMRDETIIPKLESFTKKINQNIIKKKEKFITMGKNEKTNDIYNFQNLKNILDFIKTQNSMYYGDIMEGILIIIFSYGFETSKTNEFGKYLYLNIAKLRDPSNTDLVQWFKKSNSVFVHQELKDFKKLLDNDFSLTDVKKGNESDISLIYKFLIELTRHKFAFINEENKSEFNNNKELVELMKILLYKIKTIDRNSPNISMIDKDFIGNSIAYIYYYLLIEKKEPPIKILKSFLISIYIYYQNEHSPLMKYSEPYIPKDDKDDELVTIPFTYMLKGSFVEGRFANIIISPIKVEPKIVNINLGQNNIREWGLFELGKTISMNKSIKSLILKISLVRGYFLDFFVAGFGIYDNYSIEELNISMNYLKEDTGNALLEILTHLKNLKTLNLSANELRGGGKSIFIYLNKQYRQGKSKLENLYLNNCTLDDGSFYELGELLKSKSCKLKKLNIGINPKSNVINFLKKIKTNKNLVELNICKNGLQNKDIDDICRIISNTNIKLLNLYKNEFNIFGQCLKIVFRTKLVKKKKELNEDKQYVIDRSSSLLSLDLSNNLFYSINKDHINLIIPLVKNNSTLSCLDLSHIFFGPYPDKSTKNRSITYKKLIEEELKNIVAKRKEKFKEDYHEKFVKEIDVKEYENKKKDVRLIKKLRGINEDIDDIIDDPNSEYDLFLKEKSEQILSKIEEEREDSDDDEIFKPTREDENIEQIKEYIKNKRNKKELNKYNRLLGEKNLILI